MDGTKSFKYWLSQEVEEVFGIRRVREMPLLDRWLNAEMDIAPTELESAERLRLKLELKVDNWNEATLKFAFIGPLVSLVDFYQENYSGFSEQPLRVREGEVDTQGNVDFLVASGSQVAKAPFYLLHEYKPEMKAVMDPKGQLLIAMIAARRENEGIALTQPVYGTYVLGRLWFFVLLNGDQYMISRAYDATQADDFAVIFRALHTVKHYIDQLFAELEA